MDRTEKSSQRAYFVRVVSESNQNRRALRHRPARLSGSNRKRGNRGPARRARDRHSHEVDTDVEKDEDPGSNSVSAACGRGTDIPKQETNQQIRTNDAEN
jgi:hypothetical protein